MTQTARRPFAVYFERQNLIMLALGFSSGLPFMLVANTLGLWMSEENVTLTNIGYMSWVGLAYSFKFVWAPLIDRFTVWPLSKLGHRRSWMLLAQITVCLGLAAMGHIGVGHSLAFLAALAVVVAFGSASQDIVVDAWRIESARNADELAVFTSAYTFGYRVALLASEAIILLIATRIGWNASYILYGGLMAIGATACLLAVEPKRAAATPKILEAQRWSLRSLADPVIGPILTFVKTHGTSAVLMLVAISLFHLPNFMMGPMANPLYHYIGLTKDTIGTVRGTFGLVAVFAGVGVGGYLCLKLGHIWALVVGGTAQILGTMAYAILPFHHDPATFAIIMAADNFGIAVAGVTLVTYISSLTSFGYTATQYALLSSTYTWVGKLMKGTSGKIVDGLTPFVGREDAFALFFTGAGLIGIPAIVLFLVLASQRRQNAALSK